MVSTTMHAHKHRQIDDLAGRQKMGMHRHRDRGKKRSRQADRETGRQAGKQTGRQTCRHADGKVD